MKKNIVILIILVNTFNLSAICQSVAPFVIASTGTTYLSSNVQLSWTLGEVATSTFSASNSIITQGFQQNIYTVVAINDLPDNPFKIIVFPNPTKNNITIQWEKIEKTDIIINIIDNLGVNILRKIMNSSENQAEIDLSNYPISTYIITISTTNSNYIKHFKIIKK